MEFLVVSKTKLKIILDKDDVEKYRLSDFSSSDSRELRYRLREIMSIAKERVGFDGGGDKLLVSYYPTRLSGAELFVSVINSDSFEETSTYYIFDSLAELSRACRAVANEAIESSVFLLPSDEYCLETRFAKGKINSLSEFSPPFAKAEMEALLNMSKCLCKSGAIELFASL